MVCIYCGKRTKVTNSRPQVKMGQTWRRRECTGCHAVFTSVEQIALSDVLRAKKRSGQIEHFERDKLFLSLNRSIDHLPQNIKLAKELTNTTLSRLFSKKPMSPIIETSEIARVAAKVLKSYDAAAAVRYMSFQASLKKPSDVRSRLIR